MASETLSDKIVKSGRYEDCHCCNDVGEGLMWVEDVREFIKDFDNWLYRRLNGNSWNNNLKMYTEIMIKIKQLAGEELTKESPNN